MQRDEADGLAHPGHNMKAAPRLEHFVRVVFERHVPGHRWHLGIHDVPGTHTGESASDCVLDVSFLRGTQQKPPNEYQPDASDEAARKRIENAPQNHQVGKKFPGERRNLSRLVEILGDTPGDPAQYTAAVERETRDQIENGQNPINFREPVGGSRYHLPAVGIFRDHPKAACQEQARNRPGDRYVEFFPGAIGIARNSGKPAENEKRDRVHRNLIMPCHDAMAQLMEQHGPEKEEAGDQPHRPMLHDAPLGMLRLELFGDREGDKRENDEPTAMYVNRNAENASEADSRDAWRLR